MIPLLGNEFGPRSIPRPESNSRNVQNERGALVGLKGLVREPKPKNKKGISAHSGS